MFLIVSIFNSILVQQTSDLINDMITFLMWK